jgi:bacterioferritin
MKGKKKVIQRLNELLADELAAINQYIVQSEMCANWGYTKLHDAIKKQAIEEMKHAEKLIERILFLEGTPEVGGLKKIRIGKNIEEQMANDVAAEGDAILMYNEAIRLALDEGDEGTAALLRSILSDEERHIDWLETQVSQIADLELHNYLAGQMG